MAETYIQLSEAAELEGINYEALKKKIQRNPEKYSVKKEHRESGGRELTYIALESLSREAKRKHAEKNKIAVTDEKEKPWYVDIDVNWYKEKYKQNYYKAIELRNVIKEFVKVRDKYRSYGDRTEYATEYAKQHGMSQRTLYRYEKAYLEATAWSMKLEQEDGCSYEYLQVLALCRKPKEEGKFPSLSNEVKTLIENIWFDKGFAQNRPTIEMLYFKLEQEAGNRGWKYPSYQTVARYIHYLMEDCNERNAHYLLANGTKEYRNKVMHKCARDLGALPVMGMVQGDEHTFDCWVAYRNTNGKVTAIKPKLVAWIDMRSRAIMGDIMCKDANMQILKQSLIKMIYSEVGGVPQCILIDNGKDYTAKAMTGRNRKERRAETEPISLDSEAQGFYKSIGIQDDFRALPYSGWVKAQIERFFGSVCSQFTKWFDSYTGTLTGSKTAGKVKKDIPKLLEQGKLLTIEEFYELWEKWKNEFYMQKVHRGLKAQKEEYTTPLGCFQNAEERYFKAPPPRSYAAMLLMKAERVHVSNQGIKRFGTIYYSSELADYQGKKVDIKYDPNNLTSIFVYTTDGKQICEAKSQELLQVAPRVSQKALEEHLKEQNRQLKKDRERIANRQKTLAERSNEHEEADNVVGGLELTIGKKQTAKKNNVVSIPTDRQYAEKKKADVEENENTFFADKARAAMDMIQQLG